MTEMRVRLAKEALLDETRNVSLRKMLYYQSIEHEITRTGPSTIDSCQLRNRIERLTSLPRTIPKPKAFVTTIP